MSGDRDDDRPGPGGAGGGSSHDPDVAADGSGDDPRAAAGADGRTGTGVAAQEEGTLDRAWALGVRYQVPIGLLLLVVLLRPVLAQPYVLGFGAVASTILIWMLFVASINFLFGFSGLLSFGHAMFLGVGVYSAAIGVSQFDVPYLLAAPVGILGAGLLAYVLGVFIVQKGEIYFALLTLAFAQAVRFVVNRDPWGLTGGSNGLTQDTLPGWIESFRGDMFVELGAVRVDWYWAVSVVFVLAMLGLWQVLRSPFGRSLVAIRDNADLARAMGIDVRRYRIAAFTISGAFAGLAGALLSINNHGAAYEDLAVTTSGDAVLMAVLGGVRFFAGPIAGTFVWMFAEQYLTDISGFSGIFDYWHFFLGALIVFIVVVSPREGVWGAVRTLFDRARRAVADRRGGGVS